MWRKVKLGDFITVQNGYAFNSKLFDTDGAIGLIRIRDLKEGTSTETRYTGEFDSKFVVKSDDLLIGMDGEFRCYEWKGEDALLNQRVCRLQDFNKDLDKRFLLYAINDELKKIEDVTGFTTVKHLSSKTIKEIPLLLPPLAEQQRIVAKLDAAFVEIDTAIETAEKCVTDAIAIYDTHLDRKFSDLSASHPKHLMHDACDLIDSLHKTPKYTDDGYPMIRVADVKPGRINFDNAKRVDEDTFKEFSKRHTAEIGDIILSRVGSYGVSAIVSENVEFCLGQNTVFIIPKGNSKYLYYFLNSPFAQRQMDSLISGVAQPTISLKSIKSLTIPLPNEKTQIEISANFEKLWLETQNLSKTFKEKSFQLVKLKSAILAQELQSEAA